MTFSISRKIKSQLNKILWITICWSSISLFYFTSTFLQLKYFKCPIDELNTWVYLKGSIISGLMAGVMGGSGMVFLWEGWLRTKKYGWSLFSIFWTYTLIYLLVAIPNSLYTYSSDLHLPFYSSEVTNKVWHDLSNHSTILSFLFWLIVVVGTLFILLVNDKYGPGVLKDFLLGKYFHPKREERIFMFLDLRSSTTIAENLGETRYFNFLKDVFKYATPSILNNGGEIYQYVGDEIVISWKVEKGIDKANCLQCFFDIQKALNQRFDYFEATYDVKPEFKAGLHFGHVMTGEIGVVKREIAFTGDVLNTTSRIQEKCNELSVNLLLSHFLLEKLDLKEEQYRPRMMGGIQLRGKKQMVTLYTV